MNWTRLNVVVEGQTEESFINEVLGPHLSQFCIDVSARMVANRESKSRKHKGGLSKFEPLRRDLKLWMREDHSSETRFTCMVDLYAYPSDAPAYDEACRLSGYEKVKRLECALRESVNDHRFVPYIQLHEYETILFSDLERWSGWFPDQRDRVEALAGSVVHFENIELINDGPQTAPSKRILQKFPSYDKVTVGSVLAIDIGLKKIRTRCRHFDEWVAALESFGSAQASDETGPE